MTITGPDDAVTDAEEEAVKAMRTVYVTIDSEGGGWHATEGSCIDLLRAIPRHVHAKLARDELDNTTLNEVARVLDEMRDCQACVEWSGPTPFCTRHVIKLGGLLGDRVIALRDAESEVAL